MQSLSIPPTRALYGILRPAKALAILALLISACTDSLAPLEGDLLVLQSIDAEPLPTRFAQYAGSTSLLYADTLALRADGTGERRWAHDNGDPGSRTSDTEGFSWTMTGSKLSITFNCPPGADCIAGPHFVGTLGPTEYDVTQSMVSRQPLKYRRVLPPLD